MAADLMTRVEVPDDTWFDASTGSWMHTGHCAEDALDWLPHGTAVATDIETPGLERNFVINCVTMAWHDREGRVHAALLDPTRNPRHAEYVHSTYANAGAIILHNAPFDIPPLWHAGLMDDALVRKIVDTVVLARFAYPDAYDPVTGRKTLENLAVRLLGMTETVGGMERAFKAAGFKTIQAGYEGMDIDSPIYRRGAMADTVATLALEPVLRDAAIKRTLDHPFVDNGATTVAQAEAILGTQEQVHRIMLRRSAVGLAVDLDYLAKYQDDVSDERSRWEAELAKHGLEGGSGKNAAVIEYLHGIGELPEPWPRTKTRKLQATKDLFETLEHPLAAAQRAMAATDKVMGYLAKVSRQAAVTGRCHPQVGTLGASATGRMSYGSPELQQFSGPARGIITDDGQGLTSIDWSQIEPVTMALMARDEAFLAPFEAGEDLYEPIQRACGIDRPLAKVILLATMYGQGAKSMARRINHTEESAAQIRRQMLSAMPRCRDWMAQVESIAMNHGCIVTAGGRILPVDQAGSFRAVNYICQGSAYDVLAHTITEMDRQGMGNHIQLAMHDEVVVDTEVAAEVQQIMLTAPPFLERWAGRVPVLRTDRADMGHVWAKV